MFSNSPTKASQGQTLLENSCQRHSISFTFNKGAQDSDGKCQHLALPSWQKQWTQLKIRQMDPLHYALS